MLRRMSTTPISIAFMPLRLEAPGKTMMITPPTMQLPPTAERIERLLMDSELMESKLEAPGIWSIGLELREEKQDVISTASTIGVSFAIIRNRGQ